MTTPKSSSKSQARHPAPHVHEVVDPRWILSALGIVFLVALVCAYITICALFYRNQWQLALQPSRTFTLTPASLNLPFEEVHFGVDASGQPQLDGWYVPAGTPGTRSTVLILHNGADTMSDAVSTAANLHALGRNVLLFDYRGFGRSGGQHPSQSLMQADTLSAFRYLTDIRGIPAAQIIPYGLGVGASLAVNLCTLHPEIQTLILEDAEGDIDRRLSTDPRARIVPAHLLFNQDFPLAAPLHTLVIPKLLLTEGKVLTPSVFQQAADPKMTVELPAAAPAGEVRAAIARFLPPTVPTLQP